MYQEALDRLVLSMMSKSAEQRPRRWATSATSYGPFRRRAAAPRGTCESSLPIWFRRQGSDSGRLVLNASALHPGATTPSGPRGSAAGKVVVHTPSASTPGRSARSSDHPAEARARRGSYIGRPGASGQPSVERTTQRGIAPPPRPRGNPLSVPWVTRAAGAEQTTARVSDVPASWNSGTGGANHAQMPAARQVTARLVPAAGLHEARIGGRSAFHRRWRLQAPPACRIRPENVLGGWRRSCEVWTSQARTCGFGRWRTCLAKERRKATRARAAWWWTSTAPTRTRRCSIRWWLRYRRPSILRRPRRRYSTRAGVKTVWAPPAEAAPNEWWSELSWEFRSPRSREHDAPSLPYRPSVVLRPYPPPRRPRTSAVLAAVLGTRLDGCSARAALPGGGFWSPVARTARVGCRGARRRTRLPTGSCLIDVD